jgi:hypothetical protein
MCGNDVRVADDETIALDDPNLDVPAHPREADLVVRVGGPDLFHVECQAYRDATFIDRVFGYHLALALRHPSRHVRTFALWTRAPPPHQRATTIRRGDITIEVQTIVLPEIPATLLLEDAATVCFAAGAHLAGMSVTELCDRVALALKTNEASDPQKYLAAMVAATQGRYAVLVRALEQHDMQPVIIEDLVDYGFDQGIEKGIERGRLAIAHESLFDVLDARGLSIDEAQRSTILAEGDLERLRAWLRRAVTAASVAEVISGGGRV